MNGKVFAICISKEKGIKKSPVKQANLIKDFGIEGDAHFGSKKRQVSLLSLESIKRLSQPDFKLKPGDFAENITVKGLDLKKLKIGDYLKIGKYVELIVTQVGKECLRPCNIYKTLGNCIMPIEGIFCKVIKGGRIRQEDTITIKETDVLGEESRV